MNITEDKLAGRTALERYLIEQVDTAVANHNITVYYQPIIRTITGKICAFEALARWDDPIHGMITPSVFLAVLEAARQTHKLDVAVVEEVCHMLAERQVQEQPLLPISLNLSQIDFLAGDFFDIVEITALSGSWVFCFARRFWAGKFVIERAQKQSIRSS